MKRLALIAALTALALPAAAQQGTFIPVPGSQYGGMGSGPPAYTFQYHNNSGSLQDIARQQLQRFYPPTTTCTIYGNQTVCN